MNAPGLLDDAMGRAGPVADVVLREGRVLFPYRASALKNRYRWQWGVLAPPAWVRGTGSDRCATGVDCIADASAAATVAARVRFVHLQARSVAARDGRGRWARPDGVPGDAPQPGWDEAIERHVDVGPVTVPAAGRGPTTASTGIDAPAATGIELLHRTADATTVIVRRRRRVRGAVRLDVERLPGPWSLVRVRVVVENSTPWRRPRADRADALRSSLVAAHVVLAVDGGAFISSVDPPEFAAAAVATCRNDGLWPALIGPTPAGDAVLAAPIILPDHPRIAGPSPGDSCDATEIDELLALSVRALGDDERREARTTDPIAAAIVDRVGSTTPDGFDRLHAAAPVAQPVARVGGVAIGRGARVRLRPRPGGDAQDLFVEDRVGVVEAVLHDVDGGTHLAVTIEDDPGADLHRWQGRYRYFGTDEVEPLGATDGA